MQRWSGPRVVGIIACVALFGSGFMPAHTFISAFDAGVREDSVFAYSHGLIGVVAALALGCFILNRRWADVTALLLTGLIVAIIGVVILFPDERLAPWNLYHYGLDVAAVSALVAAIMAAVCIVRRRRSRATPVTDA